MLDLTGFTFLLQPYPQFTGGLNVFDSSDYSNYAGLQFIFKRRISNGLGFQFGYTLSKSKDNRSWDPSLSTVSTGSVQSASSTPFDLRDRSLNYAWSDFDRRHVFQGTYTYELPFGKGRTFLSGMPSVLNYVIGGWETAGTVLWASGRPFTVYSGINTVSPRRVQLEIRAEFLPRSKLLPMGRVAFEEVQNYGKSEFPVPCGCAQRLNNPSFDNPTAVITSTTFGRINDTVTNNARRIQLSGKIIF